MSNAFRSVFIIVLIASAAYADDATPDVNQVVGLVPTEYRHRLVQRLSLAEQNRGQLLALIQRVRPEHREAAAFLIVNMPERDLKSLSADFLLHDIELAYQAAAKAPWGAAIPKEIFLNDVLPYANLNEKRDDWRGDFMNRFFESALKCKSAGDAAQMLNKEIFKKLDVAYHATKRPKPDQSPYESMEAHFASCSGLSILLVDACRAVGVPARVAGTPRWSDNSGNHTWVEVWDGQWRFIGAAEPGPFNQTWFAGNAAKADASKPEHRIYAASFQQTGQHFPMVWNMKDASYPAVDVTAFYVKRGSLAVGLPAVPGPASCTIQVRQGNQLVAQAKGKEALFELAADSDYLIQAFLPDGKTISSEARVGKDNGANIKLVEEPKSAAVTPKPIKSSDLDGDWAQMKPIRPRGYVAGRAKAPITVDGRGDEVAWAEAAWTEEFKDIEGDRRPAPRFKTRAKMLWDDHYLYIHAQLEEPHVWGTITRKNEVIFQDNDFEVFIDPDGDNHNYYEFEMNALNTIWELTLVKPYRDGGPVKNATNIEGLKSAVHIDGTLNQPGDTDRSWSVEIAIPWKGLAAYAEKMSCPPKDGEQWRIDFSRVEWLVDIIDGKYRKIPKEMRNEDNWVWSPQGVIDMHRPERWGYVQFSSSEETKSYKPDATLTQRDALMTVYHRQREFYKRLSRYAASAGELGLADNLTITRSADGAGYTASSKDGWRVQQDSKLWRE